VSDAGAGASAAAAGRLSEDRLATLARLAALERDFDAVVAATSQANADDEHDPEGATIAFERQHLAALIAQAREHLAGIEVAQRRLDDGSYGRCSACGQPIGADRLAARPTATTCISCATAGR
jgi:RNA polymerase-binding transcription factor DksA